MDSSAGDGPRLTQRILLIDDWPGRGAVCGSGIGSSLFKLAAAADARARGTAVDWRTAPAKAALLEGSPVIERLWTGPDVGDLSGSLSRYDAIVSLGILALEDDERLARTGRLAPFTRLDRERYRAVPHLAFWREFLARALALPAPAAPAEFPLSIAPAEIDAARRHLPGAPSVLGIAPQAVSHLKRYFEWPRVIELLHERRPALGIVLLGDAPWPWRERPGAVNLCGRTSVRELMALLACLDAAAASDGLVTNLAMALGRPAVALFGMIAPEAVIDPAQARRSMAVALVEPGCPLMPCYPRLENYRSASCPLEPTLDGDRPVRCMRFAPERVAAAILEVLDGLGR
jgi:hypothetical protein